MTVCESGVSTEAITFQPSRDSTLTFGSIMISNVKRDFPEPVCIVEIIRGDATVFDCWDVLDEVGYEPQLIVVLDELAENKITDQVVDGRSIKNLTEPLRLLLNAECHPTALPRLT